MSILEHIWLSISRRLSKSLILILIIFVLGNVLCASLSITNSMNELEKSVKEKLGINVNIVKNEEQYIYQDYFHNKEKFELLQHKIDQLKERNKILYSDFQCVLNGFKSDSLLFNNTYFENYNVNNLYLIGISETQFIDQIEENIEIIKGRYFTNKEIINKERVIIISECFTNNNEIKIGDEIQLKRDFYDENIEANYINYTVIGIFRKNSDSINSNSYNIENYDTHIYIPLTTMLDEYEKITNYYNLYPNATKYFSLELNEIKVKVANVDFEDEVINYLNKSISLLNDNNIQMYKIKSSADIYDKIASPLSLISKIATILKIVAFSSLCILSSLCIFLFLKDRKYEIAVLYSLGQKKQQIIFKQFLEIYIICMLSITLSLISGYKIAQLYSKHMVENQIETIKYQYIIDNYEENLFDDYSMNFDINYLKSVYIIISLVSGISTILPTIYILRLNPKKLLM